jgi:hypothetical protein
MKLGVRHLSGLLGALLLVAPAAKSQGRQPSSGDLSAARRLFGEAAELEAHSEWSAASVKLKSALAIKETPGLRYHLAHCEEQLGAFVEAAADYDRAAELIRGGAPAPDVEPLLPLAQRRLESRIAKLDIVVPTGISAAAELDERALAASALGTSIKLDPGIHHVIVRAAGHAEYRAFVSLSVGEHRTLKILFPDPAPVSAPPVAAAGATAPETPAAPPPKTAASVADKRPSSGVRTALLVGEAALAAVGGGVGVGFGLARPGAARRVHAAQANVPGDSQACANDPQGVCAELRDAISTYRRDVDLETIGFAGAGVAAGLFAATWALWPSTRAEPAITVHPAAGGAVLSARGVF